MHRGLVRTFATSPNRARERAARSAISENAVGERNSPPVCAAILSPNTRIAAKPADDTSAIAFLRIAANTFSFRPFDGTPVASYGCSAQAVCGFCNEYAPSEDGCRDTSGRLTAHNSRPLSAG